MCFPFTGWPGRATKVKRPRAAQGKTSDGSRSPRTDTPSRPSGSLYSPAARGRTPREILPLAPHLSPEQAGPRGCTQPSRCWSGRAPPLPSGRRCRKLGLCWGPLTHTLKQSKGAGEVLAEGALSPSKEMFGPKATLFIYIYNSF